MLLKISFRLDQFDTVGVPLSSKKVSSIIIQEERGKRKRKKEPVFKWDCNQGRCDLKCGA